MAKVPGEDTLSRNPTMTCQGHGQAISDRRLSFVYVHVLTLLLICRRGLQELGVLLNLVLIE